MPEELLKVSHIAKYFPASGSGILKQGQMVKAVDDVSFTVYRGETLGIVGESGCGKSTTGRLILKMIEPTAGDVLFKGQSILHLKGRQLRQIEERQQARKNKDFARADEIRDTLAARGILLKDTREGVKWTRA